MADRRKSLRLVMPDNGKEEATEDDGKGEASGILSRKDGCLAARSVVGVGTLASDLDPSAPECLDPNATLVCEGIAPTPRQRRQQSVRWMLSQWVMAPRRTTRIAPCKLWMAWLHGEWHEGGMGVCPVRTEER
jgi:hypothetical protein